MAKYYTYLLSSLPMLSFGSKPPLSFEDLIESCRTLIPDDDVEILISSARPPESCGSTENRTLTRWRSFDTMLRNELVMIRALRKKTDPAKYLRRDGCPESSYMSHIAINAYRKPSIQEAERALDMERWRELDELALGHYFDLDALIVYAQKLLILIKWDDVQSADRRGLLEDCLKEPLQQRA